MEDDMKEAGIVVRDKDLTEQGKNDEERAKPLLRTAQDAILEAAAVLDCML